MQISLKFIFYSNFTEVHSIEFDNKSALVQVMAWDLFGA